LCTCEYQSYVSQSGYCCSYAAAEHPEDIRLHGSCEHPFLHQDILWLFCQLPVNQTTLLAMRDNPVEDHCLQSTSARGIFCNTL